MATFKEARPIHVALPAKQLTLEQSQQVLADILNKLGCGRCFSGRDINFINEVEFFVNESGRIAEPQQLGIR
jgi:hypothetical protein